MSLASSANQLLRFLMVMCLALMAILVFINVVLRYGFNSNLEITEELSRYLFVWLTFLGAISAFIRRVHIRVDTFVRYMPPRLQKVVLVFGDLCMLVCCALILVGCWRLTLLNMTNYLPISEIPVAALYFAGVPSSFFMGGLLIRDIWLILTNAKIDRTPQREGAK